MFLISRDVFWVGGGSTTNPGGKSSKKETQDRKRVNKSQTTRNTGTMGGQVSKLMNKVFGSKEMRLLMLGLDAAGKTSAYTPSSAR